MRTKLNFLKSRSPAGQADPTKPAVDAAPAPAIEAPPKAEEAPVQAEAASDPTPTSSRPIQKAARLVEGARPLGRKLRDAAFATGMGAAWGRPAALAAAIVATGGLGYAAGHGMRRGVETERTATLRLSEAASTMRQSHEEMIRLGGELKAMKVAVEALKGERDRARGELLGKQAQLSEKVERTSADAVGRIGKVAEQLERIERTQRDPARFQGVIERLERIERQALASVAAPAASGVVASSATSPAISASSAAAAPAASEKPVASAAPTPPAKPANIASVQDVTQTGSLGEAKKADDPRKTQLDGYVLRDIDDGYALIETKSGRFVEVAAGGFLPGVGRIEAIERRGRQWVVLTPKGYIGERGGLER